MPHPASPNTCPLRRHPANPILTAADVPYPARLVFNAGVCHWQGRYVMVFRCENTAPGTDTITSLCLGVAVSEDGVNWQVRAEPLNSGPDHPLAGVYDPRLTVLDGRLFLCFAKGDRGTSGGLAVTDDLERWDVLNVSVPDNRNMVLFPERMGGLIYRLERPFAGYLRPGDRFDLWSSASPDGRFWGQSRLVLTCDQLPWTNDKIGPGAPPVRTERGWLALLHAVDRDDSRRWGWEGSWNKRYSMAAVLLDLAEPWKVKAYTREPLMMPDPAYPYEVEGFRPYVLFPTGAVLDGNGELKIYYGAADTVMALATCPVDDVLAQCKPL